jgi:hypothetical protein
MALRLSALRMLRTLLMSYLTGAIIGIKIVCGVGLNSTGVSGVSFAPVLSCIQAVARPG